MHADLTCDDCGRLFPDHGEDTEDLCEECYQAVHHFLCAWCHDYGDVCDQHAYVVVMDVSAADVPLPGLYRVTRLPYCFASMLGGGQLVRSAVEWLGFLPVMHDDDGAGGHLCLPCQTSALTRIADDVRVCAMFAAYAASAL